MGITFSGSVPAITGPVQLELPSSTYSGLKDETDASVSVNPYTNQGPGSTGQGQTSIIIEEERNGIFRDPDYDSINLLLPFDGNITDEGPLSNIPNSNLNVSFSTDVKKFGTHSIRFDPNGGSQISRIVWPDNGNTFELGTGDFTVEFWINSISLINNSNQFIIDTRSGNGLLAWAIRLTSDLKMSVTYQGGSLLTTNSITHNEWYHFAVSRSSSTLRLFIDGNLEVSTSDSTAWNGAQIGNVAMMGRTFAGPDDDGFNGYLDDFRMTKGVGRYTESFAVPTKAHSTMGPA